MSSTVKRSFAKGTQDTSAPPASAQSPGVLKGKKAPKTSVKRERAVSPPVPVSAESPKKKGSAPRAKKVTAAAATTVSTVVAAATKAAKAPAAKRVRKTAAADDITSAVTADSSIAAADAPAAAPAAAAAVDSASTVTAGAADGSADGSAPATDAPKKRQGQSTRLRVEDKLAAFRRALIHPYGTLVTSLDCVQAAKDLQLATTHLSPTMMQRYLSIILAHNREMPKAARNATSRKDGPASLAKYHERLATFPKDQFAELDGAWLSHYKVNGSIAAATLDSDGFQVPAGAEDAFVVYRVAKSLGYTPLGIVSEKGTKVDKTNKDNKARTHLVSVDGRRVYIGPAMSMWDLPKSRFCPCAKDTVLLPKKGRHGTAAAGGAGTGAGAGAGTGTGTGTGAADGTTADGTTATTTAADAGDDSSSSEETGTDAA